MDGQSSNGQQFSVQAELQAPESPTAQHREPETVTTGGDTEQISEGTAHLLTELGERLGQVETLARMFPAHEQRVREQLGEFDTRLSGLADELRGEFGGLQRTFFDHKHDEVPAILDMPEHEGLPATLDNPVQAIDAAVGDALPTPPAPEDTPAVEAPPALKQNRLYRSHLHRNR